MWLYDLGHGQVESHGRHFGYLEQQPDNFGDGFKKFRKRLIFFSSLSLLNFIWGAGRL
jgi:hypothetical protein